MQDCQREKHLPDRSVAKGPPGLSPDLLCPHLSRVAWMPKKCGLVSKQDLRDFSVFVNFPPPPLTGALQGRRGRSKK